MCITVPNYNNCTWFYKPSGNTVMVMSNIYNTIDNCLQLLKQS